MGRKAKKQTKSNDASFVDINKEETKQKSLLAMHPFLVLLTVSHLFMLCRIPWNNRSNVIIFVIWFITGPPIIIAIAWFTQTSIGTKVFGPPHGKYVFPVGLILFNVIYRYF
jgi:hypothetical protein